MYRIRQAIIAATLCCATGSAAACPAPQPTLLLASCAADTSVDIVLLGPDEGVGGDPAPEPGRSTLTVTGAYTSGERVEPEGFFVDEGTPFDPYIQGWDGLLLVSGDGQVSLHHVERVSMDGAAYNLRERAERQSFVAAMKEAGASAMQSHLLVVDGTVDVTPQPTAPRFRRRMVLTLEDGSYAVYDSSPRALTLFEATQEVVDRFSPVMAFNLDMGSYDYCRFTDGDASVDCGTLDRDRTEKLSNLLVFTQTD